MKQEKQKLKHHLETNYFLTIKKDVFVIYFYLMNVIWKKYAVKKFLESKYNPDKLYEYAEKLGILEKVKAIIEVK